MVVGVWQVQIPFETLIVEELDHLGAELEVRGSSSWCAGWRPFFDDRVDIGRCVSRRIGNSILSLEMIARNPYTTARVGCRSPNLVRPLYNKRVHLKERLLAAAVRAAASDPTTETSVTWSKELAFASVMTEAYRCWSRY
jgi:hypothetical protein